MIAARYMVVGGALLAAQLSCGGDDPPLCPTGNCTLPGSTVVKWKFNSYPEWLFESDACSDVGAVTVRVEVTSVDDPNLFDMAEKGCGEGQLTFLDLPVGMYNVAVTPIDIDGAPLVKAAVAGQGLAGSAGAPSEVVINVPHTAWSRTYTGQFLFRLKWGGMSCEATVPPVTRQILTLTAGGQVVTTARTDTNQKVDGTDPAPCRLLSEQFPQYVQALPFGPATLLVIGTENNGNVLYEQQFDTFIGAGMFNPTITFDVPADAGVDAIPPDAAIDAM